MGTAWALFWIRDFMIFGDAVNQQRAFILCVSFVIWFLMSFVAIGYREGSMHREFGSQGLKKHPHFTLFPHGTLFWDISVAVFLSVLMLYCNDGNKHVHKEEQIKLNIFQFFSQWKQQESLKYADNSAGAVAALPFGIWCGSLGVSELVGLWVVLKAG